MTDPWDNGPETNPTREFRQMKAERLDGYPPQLMQVEGPGAPREVRFLGAPLVIGRSDGCDVQVISSHISRRHAVVQKVGDDIECRDLTSRNGTWLNNLRVNSATLREGDIVQIGDAVFVFRSGR